MKKFFFLLTIIITTLMSCNKEDFVWNLSRKNNIDSLQNENPNNPQWPVAKFICSNTSVPIGSSITFISTSTQNPTTYNWAFPGGTPSSSNQNSTSILYNSIGKFDVSLLVTNSNGSDSVIKPNYIEAYYLKSFNNGSWDGWSNSGWNFSSSPTCSGCIYAWQNSSSIPISYTISKSFSNVSLNSTLEFYYYIYSPGGTLKVKVNGVDVWSNSGYGSNSISVQLPSLSNFTLTFEALVGYTQSIYLNDLKIRP